MRVFLDESAPGVLHFVLWYIGRDRLVSGQDELMLGPLCLAGDPGNSGASLKYVWNFSFDKCRGASGHENSKPPFSEAPRTKCDTSLGIFICSSLAGSLPSFDNRSQRGW